MKRSIGISVLLLVVGLLVGLLAVAASAKVTIKFSTWGSPEEVNINKELIKAFEAKNPDIQVELVFIPGGEYFQKIQTMIAGGTAPDVMFSGTIWAYDLFTRGAVIDLKPYIEKEEMFRDTSGLSLLGRKKLELQWQDGNKVFMIPTRSNVMLLYYNRDAFDEAGVAYPSESWTWDDYLGAAKKLVKWEGGRMTQAGTAIVNWHAWIKLWLLQNGASFFDTDDHPTKCTLDDPAAIDALQFIQDQVYKYKVAPTPAQSQALPGGFMTGRYAMEVTGGWMNEQYRKIKDFKWDISYLPKGKVRANHVRVAGYPILTQSKHRDEAWRFVRFMFTPEAQKLQYSKTAIWELDVVDSPATSWYYDLPGLPPSYKLRMKIHMADYVVAGESLHPNASKILDTVLPRGLDQMFLGKKTAEESVKELVPKINLLLEVK